MMGWKAIAKYLSVSVDTAKRYHKVYHMPVYKLPGSVNASVMTFTSVVDSWIITYNKLRSEYLEKKRKKIVRKIP